MRNVKNASQWKTPLPEYLAGVEEYFDRIWDMISTRVFRHWRRRALMWRSYIDQSTNTPFSIPRYLALTTLSNRCLKLAFDRKKELNKFESIVSSKQSACMRMYERDQSVWNNAALSFVSLFEMRYVWRRPNSLHLWEGGWWFLVASMRERENILSVRWC